MIRTAFVASVLALGVIVVEHNIAPSARAMPAGALSPALKSAAPTLATASPKAPTIAATSPPPLQVLTIGDSIMKGLGLSSTDAWPELIAGQNGWVLTTLACNGAGFLTLGDPADCNDNFPGIVKAAAALHPDTIIISGSSNDFGLSNAALRNSTVRALANLRTEFPKSQIIGLSTVWGDTAIPAQLAQINSQVAQAVGQVGGTYLDIGQPLSGHPELMQEDHVHPTAAGQIALAVAIQSALTSAQRAAGEVAVQAALTSAHGRQ